jgi:alpha-L-fucosidase
MDERHWFDEARLGMFIHWDHASQQGLELSWPLVGGVFSLPAEQIVSVDQYHSSAETFAPDGDWAPQLAALAKQAGVRYAVFTTRHHNGYCMWPTATTDHSIAKSQPGRDLAREFVDAFRDAGVRIGFYYSLSDWHHPDYPAWTDDDSPYRWFRWRKSSADEWQRFRSDMFAQIRELLTGYGPIDEVWFDGGWERSGEEWDSRGIEALVRELQPGALINDRLPGFGDFTTPEQFVPPLPPEGRWETCLTMNNSWGYVPGDHAYKSARQIIHTLCEIAGRGGNLLLNVSPRGDGTLPPEQVERLQAIAEWMASHGESITGTQAGLEPWQFYGPTTRRGDQFYLHLLMLPYDSVTVRGVAIKRVRAVRHLASGRDLSFSTNCSIVDRMSNPDPIGEATIDVPGELLDQHATVLMMDIAPLES